MRTLRAVNVAKEERTRVIRFGVMNAMAFWSKVEWGDPADFFVLFAFFCIDAVALDGARYQTIEVP